MTPKEKAKEVFDKMMYEICYNCQPSISELVAKQCALICCDEVLSYMGSDRGTEYWKEVKQIIEEEL